MQPTFDPSAFRRLAEKTEYETWLLEAIYAIAEQELFPTWPDAVVYPADKSKAQFFGYMRGNIVIGDWRPHFLNAGAPLVFVSTFKLLDMFVEWILESNGVRSTFSFQEKLRHLEGLPIFPPLIESRSWLKERLTGLYRMLIPLRGTIIHDKHFTAADGAIRVSSSKNNNIGPVVEISSDQLRRFAFTIVSVVKYVDGTWHLDGRREKTLRHDLDELVALHGLPLLGQKRPFHTQIRVYSIGSDPLHVDLAAIKSDLAARYANEDVSFDLRVLLVKNGGVAEAYLFPWALFASPSTDWTAGINAQRYKTKIPDDIKPEHLRDNIGSIEGTST